jgi:hypothetical protein
MSYRGDSLIMMTFGRQAQLGAFLVGKRDEAIKALSAGQGYLTDTSSLSLAADRQSFHLQAYLGAI